MDTIFILTHRISKADKPEEVWVNEPLGFTTDLESAERVAKEYLVNRGKVLKEPYIEKDTQIIFSEASATLETVLINRISKVA